MGASSLNLMLVIIAIAIGTGHRLGQRQARGHDRHAADDRAVQRHGRRRRGGDCRGGAVQRQRAQPGAPEHCRRRRLHRRRLLQRQPDCFRQAAGPDHQIGALRRPKIRQFRHIADHRRLRLHGRERRRSGLRTSRGVAVLRVRADFGRRHDAAHRRRRHAGGDFAVQRAHRACGGLSRASCSTTRR